MAPGAQRFVGEHDGYSRLRDPVIHRREIDVRAPRIEVIDTLRAAASHQVSRRWHFAEDARVSVGQGGAISVESGPVSVVLEPLEPPETVTVHRAGSPIEGGWVSRRFGRKLPTTTVAWTSRIDRTATLRTRISWKCYC